ncbi:MAG: phospholipase effector Tle1 domain-containing protein, partial [Shimia sp.]
MRLPELLRRLTGRAGQGALKPPPVRGHRTLVVIIDGTLSSLEPGRETNAGQALRLLERAGSEVAIWYEDGLQWRGWRDTRAVLTGQGLGDQIVRAYGWLASNYRPGDRIWLLGYSRGAYAVRSLGGMIGRVGLLRRDHATERNLR